MINASNYEEWFLDYLEGNLNQVQLDELKQFLDKNPELREEFQELEFVKLEKVQVPFPNKSLLKKSLDIEKIKGLSDFEVLVIRKLEGEISSKEEKELSDILKYNPHLRKEYDLFLSTKLVPELEITYDDKQKLKKKSTLIIPLWVKYAASIAAMFILVIFGAKIFMSKKTEQIIVKQDKTKTESPSIKTEIVKNNKREIKSIDLITNNKSLSKEIQHIKPATQKTIFSKGNGVKKSKADKRIIENRLKRMELATVDKIEAKNTGISQRYNANHKIIINRKPIVFTPTEEHESEFAYNDIDALTPKQLFIKAMKKRLDIDDKNYDKIDIIPTISTVINKTEFASVKVEEKNNRKEIAFSIGSFSFSRKYQID